jgi:DNA (cytosine-5)-methyltransferase 1
MSWLFSQALVAEYLPGSCSDGEPSAPSNGSRTQLAYLPPDRMTAFLRLSRFGMTFKPLTADRGAALLMSYLAAFPARTSASPEKAPASQASAAECGDTWRGSLARFDPVACLWKTAQRSLLEDSQSFSVTWPRSGMTVDGHCWELPTLAHRTSATGSGLLPTPVASLGTNGGPNQRDSSGRPGLQMAAMKWPTPNAGDSKQTGNVENWERRQIDKAAQGINLQQSLTVAVRRWPTPTARIHKGGGEFHDAQGWQESLGHARLGGGVPDWYAVEPDVGRMVDGVAARVDRLKAIGNGQVPLCAAAAWRLLTS